jgi:hypothetical protein
VVELLFSVHDKDHCQALDQLMGAIRDTPRELLSVADLLLKWATYRMCLRDNTKAVQSLQTFLQAFLQLLINHKVELADFEAQSLLPFLTEKVGHRSDRFRTSYRAIFSQLRELYPVAKMAPFMVEALHSKNSKNHSECLEELGSWVRGAGNWKICTRKGVQAIAAQCGASDAATRNAAIAILYEVWKDLDFSWDALKRNAGELTPKVLSLMQEKFRTLKAQDDKDGAAGGDAKANKLMSTPNTIRGGGGGGGGAGAGAGAGGGGGGRRAAADDDEHDDFHAAVRGRGAVPDEFGDVFTLDVVSLSPVGALGDASSAMGAARSSGVGVQPGTPGGGESSSSSKSFAFSAEKSRALRPASMLGVALDHVRELVPLYRRVEANVRVEVADPAAHSRGVTAIKAIIDLAQTATGDHGDASSSSSSSTGNTLDFDHDEVLEVCVAQQPQVVGVLLDCVQAAVASAGLLDFRVLSLVLSALMKLAGIARFAARTTTAQVQTWLSLMMQLLTSPKVDARNKTDDSLCRAVNYLTVKLTTEAPLHTSLSASYALLCSLPRGGAGGGGRGTTTATSSSSSILLKSLEKIFKQEEARGADAYATVDVASLLRDMQAAVTEAFGNNGNGSSSIGSSGIYGGVGGGDDGYDGSIAQDVGRTICRNVLRAQTEEVYAAASLLLPAGSVLARTVRELQSELEAKSSSAVISAEAYAERVHAVVSGMLRRASSQEERVQGVHQLHALRLEFPEHSISDALKTTAATEPFRAFICTELVALAEEDQADDPSSTVHQGSVSLQSRLARMRHKYQIQTNGSTNNGGVGTAAASAGGKCMPGVLPYPAGFDEVDSAAASKENGGLVGDGNLEQRQQKITQTRESLNKMRERLQKLKVGGTPTKSKAGGNDAALLASSEATNLVDSGNRTNSAVSNIVVTAPTLPVPAPVATSTSSSGGGNGSSNSDTDGGDGANKATVSNLRDRLKMWQAKHATS